MEPTSFNPYQAPASDPGSGQEAPFPGVLRPVPFEDLEAFPGFWSRIGGMFQLLFQRPLELFERVPAGDGYVRPLQWTLLLAVPLLLLVVLISLVMGAALLLPAAAGAGAPRWLPLLMAVGYPLLILASQAAGMFLGGLVNHGCLWLWGGLRGGAGLANTIRAQGYFQGFFLLAYMVPILNILVALGAPALLGMGLARMHRTDTWRGVCAAYTPVLLCCVLYLGFILVVVGAASIFGSR